MGLTASRRLPASADALANTAAQLPPCCLCRAARREAAERTLCHSLQLATACGLLVGGVLWAAGPSFFARMGTAPELLGPATQYLHIRRGPAFPVLAAGHELCSRCARQQHRPRPMHTCRHRPLHTPAGRRTPSTATLVQDGGGPGCAGHVGVPGRLPGPAGRVDAVCGAAGHRAAQRRCGPAVLTDPLQQRVCC